MNKETNINLELNPFFDETIHTSNVVWSHDNESYRFNFNFSEYFNNKPFYLDDSNPRILLEFLNSDKGIVQIYQLTIDDALKGEAHFIIPKKILGYEGFVKASVTIDFDDRTHDLGNFTFKMKRSAIDKKIADLQIYIEEFEKAKEEIDKKKEEIETGTDEISQKLKEIEDTTNEKVDEIKDLIVQNDVLKKEEAGPFEDFRSWDDTIISKMSNEFTDRGVNVMWFGAKGDGITDDTEPIKNAIKYASEINSEVVIPAGYTFIFKEIHVLNNVTLKGLGGILKLADNVCVEESKSYYLIHNLNNDNVTFEDLIVDGNKENNRFFKVADGITCVGKRSSVVHCTVINPPDSGVMFSAIDGGRCAYNIVDGATDLGFYINSTNVNLSDNSVVIANKAYNCRYGAYGIKRYARGINITNNFAYNCGNGITVENFEDLGQGSPEKINVSNNHLCKIGYGFRGKNVAEKGISISKLKDSVVQNNIIEDCSGDVVSITNIENCVITGNITTSAEIENCQDGRRGFVLENVNNSIVKDNTSDSKKGYAFYFASGVNTDFINNKGKSSDIFAMRFNSGVTNSTIKDNTADGSSVGDIEVYPLTNVVYDNNISLNATDVYDRIGIRKISAGQPLPDKSQLAPRFVGEKIVHLLEKSWWISSSLSKGDWHRITS